MICSILMIAWPMIYGRITSPSTDSILDRIYSSIPQIKKGMADDRVDVGMPSLEIDGLDFVGIIEIPNFDTRLPVYGSWNKNMLMRFPCRYTGSIYDGSLIVGGSDAAGQFDFAKTISIGDTVFVTDMTGARYSYVVEWVEFTTDVSTENLASLDSDLVLFMRNSTSFDYTVITCSLDN